MKEVRAAWRSLLLEVDRRHDIDHRRCLACRRAADRFLAALRRWRSSWA